MMQISGVRKTREEKMNKQGHMILVTDDEPDIRRNIEKALVKEGYEVKTASNAEIALQEVDQYSFDLIILDIRMPDSTSKLSKRAGVDVLQKIRAKGLAMPVIMLSATHDNTLIDEIKSFSNTRFFIKDELNSKDLIKSIQEFLD